jgi:hypothetical protein
MKTMCCPDSQHDSRGSSRDKASKASKAVTPVTRRLIIHGNMKRDIIIIRRMFILMYMIQES